MRIQIHNTWLTNKKLCKAHLILHGSFNWGVFSFGHFLYFLLKERMHDIFYFKSRKRGKP
jgi:hypothetical protein